MYKNEYIQCIDQSCFSNQPCYKLGNNTKDKFFKHNLPEYISYNSDRLIWDKTILQRKKEMVAFCKQ
jgi:hypothetical protein